MFYRCKEISDKLLNKKIPPITDEPTLELQKQNENRQDKDVIDKLMSNLNKLLFMDYYFLLEKQPVPTIFYEFIIVSFPGGSEFESYLNFFNNIVGTCEHPYRNKDLNFRVRMISHHRQIFQFIETHVKRLMSCENIIDPHQILSILKTYAKPNDVAYSIVQDTVSASLENETIDKKYHTSRFFFRYKEHKIFIEKLGSSPIELTPIENYDSLPEKDKAYIVDYMSLMATLAECDIMPWIEPIFCDDGFPHINIVTDTNLDFNLRSQFLNLILNSFINVFKGRLINSNSYFDITHKENNIGDEFWEIQHENAKNQIKEIYPIMINKSQIVEDMYGNISFEIQKQRFFNTMFKYNMFFELNYDPEEWTQKIFDHCLKLILLCLAHNTIDAHSKKRNRTYEVNENYPLDYPAQKSVFHLHFWFKRT